MNNIILAIFAVILVYICLNLYRLENNDVDSGDIHVAMIVQGLDSMPLLGIKSILYYSDGTVHFHFMVDDYCQTELEELFKDWQPNDVSVSFYKVAEKFTKYDIPDVLPKFAHKAIFMDNDLFLSADIKMLWSQFSSFSNTEMVGMVQRTNTASGMLMTGGKKYDLGLLLIDLDKIRQCVADDACNSKLDKDSSETSGTSHKTLHAAVYTQPDWLHKIPCKWNMNPSDSLDLCDGMARSTNMLYRSEDKSLAIIRSAWNVLKQLNVSFIRN